MGIFKNTWKTLLAGVLRDAEYVSTRENTGPGAQTTWKIPQGITTLVFKPKDPAAIMTFSFTDGEVASGTGMTLAAGQGMQLPGPFAEQSLYLATDTATTVEIVYGKTPGT